MTGFNRSFWTTYLHLTNLNGFNRFCVMYMSPVTYEMIYSSKNINRILFLVFLQQIATFAFSQHPELNLVYTCPGFDFKFVNGEQNSVLFRVYTTVDLVIMMASILFTSIWYILVYIKVKKMVSSTFKN